MGLCTRFRVLARLMGMVDIVVERCWGIGLDMNVIDVLWFGRNGMCMLRIHGVLRALVCRMATVVLLLGLNSSRISFLRI